MEGDPMNDQIDYAPDPGEWNPLATVTPIEKPLAVSGGRATIKLRPWSGRERLAYEDALTERMLTKDSEGGDTVRIGTYRLHAISLTVVGATGFPERDGRPMFTGNREAVEADLLALDPDTFAEIRKLALEVQPLPRADEGLEDDDEGDDEGEDPSSTPSTPQTPTDGVDE